MAWRETGCAGAAYHERDGAALCTLESRLDAGDNFVTLVRAADADARIAELIEEVDVPTAASRH